MSLTNALLDTLKMYPLRSLFLFIFVLWMIVVRAWNLMKLKKGEARIRGLLESPSDLRDAKTLSNIAEATHFAGLSAEVYRLNHLGDGKPTDPGCNLDDYLSDWQHMDLYSELPLRPSDSQRDYGAQAKLDGQLAYGVWFRKIESGHIQVALVFRGTHTLRDWWSNLRWITRFLGGWDQYDLARSVAIELPTVVEARLSQLGLSGEIEIIAAGHSALRQILGGKQELSGKFARWALTLSEYAFAVQHVPREQNRVADFLTQGQFRTRKSTPWDPALLEAEVEPSFL